MSQYQNDSIFWVEINRIRPNPYQPRKEFDESKLVSLADSIRQYGVLQPLVVTRHEIQKDDGGIGVEYELIAGERRLRASKKAGLSQVPVVIRTGEESDQMKLELAIIENLQREDLNPMDRAKAFQQLVTGFKFKHSEIARKIGKSREYVSNSLRLLLLSPEMQEAVRGGIITEGHTRPLLMLNDRLEEQATLFKEIITKKLSVREAEGISRRIAVDKARKKPHAYDSEIVNLERELTEKLGTRVQIESREVGGKLIIDFYSNDDLKVILTTLNADKNKTGESSGKNIAAEVSKNENAEAIDDSGITPDMGDVSQKTPEEGDDLYSIKNFSV